MISFTCTLPPPVNNLYRNVPRVGRVKMPRYKAWIAENEWLVQIACQDGRRLEGPYALTIKVGKPDNRKRDIDGLLKPICDLLVRVGAVRDDSDCQRVEIQWVSDREGCFVLALPTQPVPAVRKVAA
ncbi:Holliday junction resolvase RusA-like endonuclease [Methylobacterium sp. BE186]|uniref:RusA family crossover junction endodeoxyribonuclease n=1 Tax=Methylobacterium sp. BE186 TaxID=2817715 RepID=UPI002857D4A4|nr:RusA family crossover junction endodeoxyribonuclease [Methylobacterium sp. BE186]MDR7037375.1 Holliday junction resolvase RusA-like endonuclease [Methylobacterium sp. BE186]